MKNLSIILVILTIISTTSLAREKSETFDIAVYATKVRVVSPEQYSSDMNVIIQNKTLSNYTGVIKTARNRILNRVSIPSGASRAYSIKALKTDRIFFVPISPPFQEVELILGKKSYEIPPKK